jgi:FkbM family methyltransferase
MGNRVLRQLALTPHRAQLAARFMMGGPESRLEVQRRAYRKVASRVTKTLEIESDGSRFLIHPSDGPIAEQLFVFGAFNVDMTETAVSVMNDYLAPDLIEGKVFLDIGANIGTTSIPAVTQWGASRVLAVEPEAENFRLLRCNVILNDLDDRIDCVKHVVTNHSGPVTLEISASNSGDHRVQYVVFDPEEPRSTVAADGVPLDDLIDQHGIDRGDIGLVWIDTQGHEGHVLDSAPKTLAARVPVLIEFCPYMLRRNAGLELLQRLIAEQFSFFVDLEKPQKTPAVEISGLPAQYPGTHSTDLLLIP